MSNTQKSMDSHRRQNHDIKRKPGTVVCDTCGKVIDLILGDRQGCKHPIKSWLTNQIDLHTNFYKIHHVRNRIASLLRLYPSVTGIIILSLKF